MHCCLALAYREARDQISTGWEIVKELVLQAAVADAPEDTESHTLAESDPEAWWSEHGERDLGYASLLASLAPSSAARQGLLAKYFVPTEADRDAGLKEPTTAHIAIAELAKTKQIKIIVTTNFDRLVQQHLFGVRGRSRPWGIRCSGLTGPVGVRSLWVVVLSWSGWPWQPVVPARVSLR
jgi:hypothetical protein